VAEGGRQPRVQRKKATNEGTLSLVDKKKAGKKRGVEVAVLSKQYQTRGGLPSGDSRSVAEQGSSIMKKKKTLPGKRVELFQGGPSCLWDPSSELRAGSWGYFRKVGGRSHRPGIRISRELVIGKQKNGSYRKRVLTGSVSPSAATKDRLRWKKERDLGIRN